jgi:hypothetical protein
VPPFRAFGFIIPAGSSGESAKSWLTPTPVQFVEKYGRRKCLIAGAVWMFMCFMVFASVGKFGKQDASGNPAQTEGYVLIIFSCLFIAAFASTWGELVSSTGVEIPKHGG